MSDNEEDRKEEEGSGVGWLVAAGVIIGAAASAIGYFVGKSSAEGPQCNVPNRTQQAPQSQKYRNSVVICDKCSICLDDMDVAVLPCKHAFHKKCIAQWLKISNICPTCRTPVHYNRTH